MQVAVLGTLEVRVAGQTHGISGARLRVLLVALALRAGRSVSAAALADALWGDEQPTDVTNALQSLVSRLRRTLGDGSLIQQQPGGYRLIAEYVDAAQFAELTSRGREALRRGDPTAADELLREALDLWRGENLAEADSFAQEAHRLRELRAEALSLRIDADLALGRHAEVVSELDGLVAHYPLREQFAAQLMTALARSGRPAEALAVFDRVRTTLADELGIDPSPALTAVHLRILRADEAPLPTPTPPTPTPTPAPEQASDPRHTNLRSQVSSFFGRDVEVARIGELLGESRLVSVVGPGGAGKTRLATEAAAGLIDEVPDGIWLAELASVSDGADVPQTVLDSLGIRESILVERGGKPITRRDAMSRLLEDLRTKELIIVLDNCEHVVEAAAEVADQLLAHCPGLRILATSREPLGIVGESLVAVPPLGQPAPDATPEQALQFHAVQLLVDRATAVQPDFRVDESTVADVIEIVRRLDGLPLAIELAAARLRTLSVREVAARLSDRFRLLTGGSRTALPRHRTLRAVVEWSWDLLSDPERLLCERLAIFPAGATLDSAEAVCSGDGVERADMLDLLSSLVDKSLLQRSGADGTRYRMLETIREFGVERLANRGETPAMFARHARYFAALVHRAQPHLHEAGQLRWIALLEAERDNILTALRSFGAQEQAQEAVRLAIDIGWYWMLVGKNREVATWIGYALSIPGEVDDAARALADALNAIGTLSIDAELDFNGVEQGLARLADVGHRLGEIDLSEEPMAIMLRPVLAMFGGDDDKLEGLLEEALQNPDPWVRAAVRVFRTNLAENQGDLETMRSDAGIALAEFRRLGERWGLANCLQVMGLVHTLDGDLLLAAEAYEEALALAAELGSSEDRAMLWIRLADVRMRLGEPEAARAAVMQAQETSDKSGFGMEQILVDSVLADVARINGDLVEASERQAEALRRMELVPHSHPIQGHGEAMIVAMGAKAELGLGNIELAREMLARAFRAGVGTTDMPIVAIVGVGTAELAYQLEKYGDAAEILGAAARLRGSPDSTQLDIRRLTEGLVGALGQQQFDETYQKGRATDRDAAIARLDPGLLD
ncbi:predicted ATPase [Jatrophihabitans sp. GAS493]|uniref:BTAD domain-containing putative transcriptional regulator n=1 Tax=Jatrophihabitans sp. GAS493 TaxID=1907575 RepID=UPI000BBF6972|nr:BTAD domain-containing putative transcriptional regulator [Jatrophihabitans sp. GAS493]SOD72649.1 predicted ATPase [Jatrophihabitans sp. GAS493]